MNSGMSRKGPHFSRSPGTLEPQVATLKRKAVGSTLRHRPRGYKGQGSCRAKSRRFCLTETSPDSISSCPELRAYDILNWRLQACKTWAVARACFAAGRHVRVNHHPKRAPKTVAKLPCLQSLPTPRPPELENLQTKRPFQALKTFALNPKTLNPRP